VAFCKPGSEPRTSNASTRQLAPYAEGTLHATAEDPAADRTDPEGQEDAVTGGAAHLPPRSGAAGAERKRGPSIGAPDAAALAVHRVKFGPSRSARVSSAGTASDARHGRAHGVRTFGDRFRTFDSAEMAPVIGRMHFSPLGEERALACAML
jgi:hypothetical protein